MARFNFLKTRTVLFRRILGAIIVLSVAYMLYSEGIPASLASTSATSNTTLTALQEPVLTPYPAPAIGGISAWINSSPLTLSQLKGKVVLIDFWTYSCINCVRTLPYIKDWYNKYHSKGLVIIGVHTPEFDFEKQLGNVKAAVQKYGILYPVALDNGFVTWRNFQNNYWPAQYLIDKNGYVVYQHFGEGDDAVTENNIRYLLGMAQPVSAAAEKESYAYMQTPETYLGYARMQHFASPETVVDDKVSQYTFPAQLRADAWALQGAWTIRGDRVIAQQAGAALKIHFNARHVYIVMGNATLFPVKVKLLLNGEQVIANKGKDVTNSTIMVNKHTLYNAVDLSQTDNGILEIVASTPGLEVYTFTFGS